MKNHSILYLVLILSIFFSSCVNVLKYSDLRPIDYQYPNNIEKAEQLLMKMEDAHKNHLWNNISTYQVIFEEESFGFFGKKSSPFKELSMQFHLNYIPKSFTGTMEIKSGKEKGKTWGIQDGMTYQIENDTAEMNENDSYEFAMKTFQFFIEFPNRITEANIIDFIGTKMINGNEVQGVIISWNSIEPQEDIDQYIIWLDQQTNLIVEVEYTVREKFKFARGTAEFRDYNEFDSFLLPTTISSKSNIKRKGYLHVKKIIDFTPDLKTIDDLTPLK